MNLTRSDRPSGYSVYEIKRPTAVVFSVLSVLLIGSNILLVRRIDSCSRDLNFVRALQSSLTEPRRGAVVESITGFDLRGRAVSIPFGQKSKQTLLFAFSPKCSHCAKNWPTWANIISSLPKDSVRVVLLNVSPYRVDQGYLVNHGVSALPLLAAVAPKFLADFGFGATPQTVLVGQGGLIEKVWTGELGDNDADDIKRALGRSCPLSTSCPEANNKVGRQDKPIPTASEPFGE